MTERRERLNRNLHRGRNATLAVAGTLLVAGGTWLRHMVAPAVRAWNPGHGELRRAGRVAYRTFGSGDDVVVLLHGLPGTNAIYGDAFDLLGATATVIAPDLPGFGESLSAGGPSHDIGDVVGALDEMLTATGVLDQATEGRRIVMCGHSFGSLVALHWAATRGDVAAVVMSCPPLFATAEDGRRRIARMAPGAGLFAYERPIARLLSHNLHHVRPLVRTAAPLAVPHLPAPVARGGVDHTWPSYEGALRAILRCDWDRPMLATTRAGATVVLVEGDRDPLTIDGMTESIAATTPGVVHELVPGAGHDLPMSHGRDLREIVIEALHGVL